MIHLNSPSKSSWLSLVAETAGVAGAGIARVLLESPVDQGTLSIDEDALRAVVHVLDRAGHIVGACYWYGDSTDLAAGTSVDIGYDLDSTGDLRIRAWLDDSGLTVAARFVEPPEDAATVAYDPAVPTRLVLGVLPRHVAEELVAA